VNQVFSSEQFLVRRLQERDEDALSYTYDQYAPALLGAIVQIVKKKSIGEEVLQDVFLKIWSRVDQYDVEKGRFFTWMLRIAKNSALDYLKTRQSKQDGVTDEIQSVKGKVEAKNTSQTSTDTIGLEGLLQELAQDEQTVIQTLYLRGYSQSEAAEELGIPLGTVKTRARKAMQSLRSKFQLL
jgi:RNA polymerase sigma factor (sigma-70 family)